MRENFFKLFFVSLKLKIDNMGTITIDLSNLYMRLIILHGVSIIMGVAALVCVFKSKGIPALVLTIATFICYFRANANYREQRDKKILTSIQHADTPVKELLYLEVSDKNTLLTYWNDDTQKQFCFKVIGKYWYPKKIELEKLSKV